MKVSRVVSPAVHLLDESAALSGTSCRDGSDGRRDPHQVFSASTALNYLCDKDDGWMQQLFHVHILLIQINSLGEQNATLAPKKVWEDVV